MFLTLEGISKNFGGLKALNSVSFSVEKEQMTGLIGPNGAGKTTLFNIISGADRASEGRILFDNEAIDRLPSYERTRRGIARTFQLINLFEGMTVLENVIIGTHTQTRSSLLPSVLHFPSAVHNENRSRDQARKLVELVNLGEEVDTLVGELPHGRQRLVEIIRALAAKPKLLLLDEPAGGLNPQEIRILAELLKSIVKQFGITILLVEHHMHLVMNVCEKVVVLDFGQKISEGPPQMVSKDPAVIKAYLGDQ